MTCWAAGPASTRAAANRGTQMHTRLDGATLVPYRVVNCMAVSDGSSPPILPFGPGPTRGPTSPPSFRHSSPAPLAPMIGSYTITPENGNRGGRAGIGGAFAPGNRIVPG